MYFKNPKLGLFVFFIFDLNCQIFQTILDILIFVWSVLSFYNCRFFFYLNLKHSNVKQYKYGLKIFDL